MSHAHLLGTYCLAGETRRSGYQARTAHQQMAQARPPVLSSFVAEAACRSADFMAEAEAFRLASLAKDGATGATFLGGIRQGIGALLVQVGTWIQGAAPLTREPAPGV